MKTLTKEKMKKDLHLLIRELDILSSLDHPNVVKFYESYQDDKFFHLVMEYCEGGELLERIIEKGNLSENECAKIMIKICSGINYLHERGICHRDLKPENFLFSDHSDDSELKIIDFGLSKQFLQETNSANSLKTVVGTALYVAPEVLKGKYDQRCDNWSLGVILYVLLTGNPPFYGNNNNEIFNKVLEGKYSLTTKEFQRVSPQAKDLISKLICYNVNNRLTSKKALKHPWFHMKAQSKLSISERIDDNIVNLMRNFRGVGKFKKEALKVIINQMNEREIKNLKNAFLAFDQDNTGKISFQELKKVMRSLGNNDTEEELMKIMKTCDIEDNTYIYYSEFITATLDKKLYLTEEKLSSAFKYFDVDNSGFITFDNLKEAMARGGKAFPEEVLKSMITDHDLTKNGKISFEEFVEMMKSDKVESLILKTE